MNKNIVSPLCFLSICMQNTTRFDGKPIYLPGIFGKMMMKVMK
jgi:hypothetical protein